MVDNTRMTYVFYESGLSINVLYTIEDAKKRYREILEMDRNAAIAGNNLAWILAEEGKNLDEALDFVRRHPLLHGGLSIEIRPLREWPAEP